MRIKKKMAVSFLDDSAHHWWTLARRNNDGAQTMTWVQFKALFLGQYFNYSHRSRIQSDFLNMKKRNDEGVIKFEQGLTTLSYHVPHLIPDERTRIGMFVDALGGVFADKMVGVVYPTFLDAVGAAMAIETRGTYNARPRDFSGPSQGPSKEAASLSASGSSAGSGSNRGSGYGPRSRNKGHFRRPSRSQLGRQQAGQFSAGGSSQGGSSDGQTFSFGQQHISFLLFPSSIARLAEWHQAGSAVWLF
ncbi:hypothetical protein ACLB2K_008291 [Fragaria x ananassa]